MRVASEWAALFSSDEPWVTKKQKIVAELNLQVGDRFAQAFGDFVRLRANDERTLDIGATSSNMYRIGKHLDFGNDTGTPVAGDKLIHHIGSFVQNSDG